MEAESWVKRMVIALVLALAGYHALSVTLAALPDNRVSEAASPATNYLGFYFPQNWRLFAPNPVASDRSIEFRGEYIEDGETQYTEWLSWTDVELNTVRRSLIGDRGGYITTKMYSGLSRAYNGLTEEQKAIADGANEFADWEELRDALYAAGDESRQNWVNFWLRYERAITQLATQGLTAAHTDLEFTAVQHRLVTLSVVRFENRSCDDCMPPAPQYRERGWREPVPGSERSQLVITGYWERHHD